jgi:hypothetical protein
VLSKGATHVGIGVVRHERTGEPPAYFVTELFVRDVPALDPARAAHDLVDLVNGVRARAGVKPLRVDATLAKLATRAAEDHMKLGRGPAATSAALSARFGDVTAPYTAIATVLSVVPYLEAILSSPELLDPGFVAVGAGAFEGTHPVEGAGIAVVILLGAGK